MIENTPPILIAVGASAGGLEAFSDLLSDLGDKPGLAIAFVQHLDPNNKSLLADLLRKQTSLPVEEIATRTKIQPNTVYLCPPRGRLEVQDRTLLVSTPTGDDHEVNVIDHFFHSVAQTQGERGIGVILSGSGSDGTLGLKSISDAGGMTFAQDAASAKFDSMPRNAATTGVADHVMPPQEIAAELIKYVAYLNGMKDTPAAKKLHEQIQSAIPDIADVLMNETGHNFKHYKTSTLMRRIQRRMQILKLSSVPDYLTWMNEDNKESQNLFRELLIGVTAFFRDPESFQRLSEEVIPKLFKNRQPDDPVRIWIPGCATGEEAYTIAMLCHEHRSRFGVRHRSDDDDALHGTGVNAQTANFQIFASDIDERALGIARAGIYPAGIADHVSQERLKQFFVKKGKRYHVKKEVRETVLFSPHNLISDPPFSRQDLISCRNLLIYLGPHLQKKLIPLFHFALRPSGFLFLGPSESISAHGDLFRPVDPRHRISQRKGSAIGRAAPLSMRKSAGGVTRPPDVSPLDDDRSDVVQIMQRIVLDEFAPKSVVVDEEGQLICSSADTSNYLTVGDGTFQNNILKMARRGLRIGLRATLSEAKAKRRRVTHENLSVPTEDGKQRVMITVQPMMRLGEDSGLFMVVFHDVGLPMGLSANEPDQAESYQARATIDRQADEMIDQLERELSTTRDDLERTMQEMEAANEEMKSSNEELLSMNEELQSANEELETSREEIRASSEAVSRVNADLENLLRSTQIATIFLDDDGCIRSFTPAATQIYELIPTDAGRSLTAFVPHVEFMPPLPSVDALDVANPAEDTVTADDGQTYIRRVLPYQNENGVRSGMVVTFTDVSELRDSERRLAMALDATSDGAWDWDIPNGRVVLSDQWLRSLGYERSDATNHIHFREQIVHPDDIPHTRELLQQHFEGLTDTFSCENRLRMKSGEYRWNLGRGRVVQRDADGKPIRMVGTDTDITPRKSRELHLEFLSDLQTEFNLLQSVDGLLTMTCRRLAQHLGLDRCAFVEMNADASIADVVFDHNDEGVESIMGIHHVADFHSDVDQQTLIDGRMLIYNDVAKQIDNPRHRKSLLSAGIASACNATFIDNGRIKYILAAHQATPRNWSTSEIELIRDTADRLCTRIDRAKAEAALAEEKAKMDLAMEISHVASWTWDFEKNQPSHDPNLNRLWGFDPDTVPRMTEFIERMDAGYRDHVAVAIERALAEGGVYHQEYPIHLPGGQTRWVQAFGRASAPGETPRQFLGVVTDITQRKSTELELLMREGHLRQIINGTPFFFAVLDAKGTMLEVNDTALQVAGIDRDEAVGKPFWETYWWNFDEANCDTIRSLIERASQSESIRVDLTYRTAGDIRRPVDFSLTAVKNADGQVTHLIPSGVDIADRVLAQNLLAASENELQLGVEVANLGLVNIDYHSETFMMSSQAASLYGFGDEEISVTRKAVHDSFHVDDRNDLERRIADCINGANDGLIVCEHRVTHPDGTTLWLDVRKQVFFDRSVNPPRPTHGILATRDITDVKNAEQQLREEKIKMQVLFDQNAIHTGVVDLDGVLIDANDAAMTPWGLNREDCIGRIFWEAPWFEGLTQTQEKLKAGFTKALAGESYQEDVRFVAPGGTYFGYAAFSFTPARDDDGDVAFIIASGSDVTQRYQQQAELAESRSRLKTAMQAARMGSFVWDRVTDETVWDAEWQQAVGMDVLPEMTGKAFFDLIHPDDLKMLQSVTQDSLEGKADYKCEFRIIRPDGQVRWLAGAGNWIKDDGDQPRKLAGLNWDITEQKETELTIRLNEERLRVAAGAAGFGAFHVDLDKDLVHWSDEFKRLVGLGPEDRVVGIGELPDFIHPDDAEKVLDHMNDVLKNVDDPDHWLNHRIIKKNGEQRHVRLQTRSLYEGDDDQKRVKMIVGTLLDITSQQEFEQKLLKARRVAEAANASKSQFVANMSHEIRTPMTAILGYAELLQDRAGDDEMRGYLRTIRRNGDYLLEIINDILDLSKIEAGKMDIAIERFEPARIVEDVRSIMEVRATEAGIKLDVEYATPIPKVIESDSKRLKQILINLVGNAVKFTRHGSVTIGIHYQAPVVDLAEDPANNRTSARSTTSGGQLHLSVTDTGIGMSVEQRNRLFKPFSQGDSMITQQFGGTGLGLAISQRLATMLGGKIVCESEPGRGSTFTATVNIGDLQDIAMITPDGQPHEPVGPEKPDEDLRLDAHILIVDDRRDIRFLSKHILGKAGSKITEAEDGLIAIETVNRAISQNQTFDLVLLDMQMPNLDGYETAAALRRLGFAGPIIALTADAMQGDMNKCLQAGCNDYLSKPIDRNAMLQKVATLLDK